MFCIIATEISSNFRIYYKGTVLSDFWYGIFHFLKELQKLDLIYVIEIKSNYTVKVSYK